MKELMIQKDDFHKTDKSKKCIIYHYWFFKDKNFNFEKLICNGCQLKKGDLLQFSRIKIFVFFTV